MYNIEKVIINPSFFTMPSSKSLYCINLHKWTSLGRHSFSQIYFCSLLIKLLAKLHHQHHTRILRDSKKLTFGTTRTIYSKHVTWRIFEGTFPRNVLFSHLFSGHIVANKRWNLGKWRIFISKTYSYKKTSFILCIGIMVKYISGHLLPLFFVVLLGVVLGDWIFGSHGDGFL